MKSRVNLFLWIGSMVFLLAIAVSGYLLFRGFADLADSEKLLEDRRLVLSNFFQKKPFPSPENVASERKNVQKLTGLYNSLLTDLSKEQIQTTGLSPSTFMSVLSEKRNKLAAEAKDSETTLGQDVGFGFEKYLDAQSTLPAPEHVPRLTQQLMIVERLCAILFGERIRELSVVKREEFEGVVPVTGGTPRRRANSLSAAGTAQVLNAGVLGTNDLFTAFRFTLEFKSGEKALTSILNRLASSGIFMVVRKIEMTKETSDVREARLPSVVVGPDDARPAETNAVSSRTMSRQERMVSGIGREVAMKIALEIEAYRFREPAQ